MKEFITIQNEILKVTISLKGAQIRNLTDGNNEYIWQVDEKIWGNSAPVLFPICGRLNNNYYLYGDKRYDMEIHGFARNSIFRVEHKGEEEVTLLLTSNEVTRNVYPFEFEFRVFFKLDGQSLYVTYSVKNAGDGSMYFSFGGHEGYACPQGVEQYSLSFPEDTVLTRYMLRNGFLYGETEDIKLQNHCLPLRYSEFEKCTYVFQNLKSQSVILSEKNGDRSIKVDFEGFPVLALWTLQDRKYLCIEPWCGLPEQENMESRLEEKQGVICLGSGETFSRMHTITIL